MPTAHKFCFINGCGNSTVRGNSDILYYKFPNVSVFRPWKAEKHKMWLNAVKPYVDSDWQPRSNSVICSAHFVNGVKSENPRDPSYVPSIFSTSQCTPNSESQTTSKVGSSHHKNKRKNDTLKRGRQKTKPFPTKKKKICETDPTNNVKNEKKAVMQDELNIIDIDQEDKKPILEVGSNVNPILDSIDTNESEIKKTSRSIECQTDPFNNEYEYEFRCFSCTFKCENGCNIAEVQASLLRENKSEKDIEYVDCGNIDSVPPKSDVIPGFNGHESLDTDEKFEEFCGVTMNVFNFLLSIIPEISCERLSKENKLLIVLMKLRLGLPFTCLSILFNEDRSTVSETFHFFLKLLASRLKRHIFWPRKTVVSENLPKIFQDHYKSCRVIIDIIEINLQVSKYGTEEVLKFPEYNQISTLKVLVGCTPNGLVSFKSKPFGEKLGDCFIINNSKILNQLEKNDLVLANRTFPHIQKGVESKHAIFVCPPYIIRNPEFSDFSEKQIQETYRIAVHIENIFEQIKFFKIMKSLPAELIKCTDDILTVICALNNLSPSLLSLSHDPLFEQF